MLLVSSSEETRGARLASEECPRFAERTEANVGESCPNDGEMLQKRLRNGSCEAGSLSAKEEDTAKVWEHANSELLILLRRA